MANQCQTSPDLPEALWTTWVHSYEDDTDSTKAFRPSSYEFPPARGRERFELKEDGTFLYYGIAPNDGYSAPTKGSWKWNDRRLKATVPGRSELSIVYQEVKEKNILFVQENE